MIKITPTLFVFIGFLVKLLNLIIKKPRILRNIYVFSYVDDDELTRRFFRLLLKLDFPSMDFSLYFMGYENPADVPSDPKERAKFCFSRKATLELTQ